MIIPIYSSLQITTDHPDYIDADVFIVEQSKREWKRRVTKDVQNNSVDVCGWEWAKDRFSEWVEHLDADPVPEIVVAEFEKHIPAIYTRFGVSPLRYWAEKYAMTQPMTPSAV